MRIIHRNEQNVQAAQWRRPTESDLKDSIFDGVSIPREIVARNWVLEGTVHNTRILSNQIDSTRYFVGPQVCITRDDNRRTTWAAHVESSREDLSSGQLILSEFIGPQPSTASSPPLSSNARYLPRLERSVLAEGDIWRYHIALNKFTGKVSTAWINRSQQGLQIWLDGKVVETKSSEVDFPFLAFSQVPVGHVATNPAPFSILSYKCRKTGRIFIRRITDDIIGPEVELEVGETRGGVSFGIIGERVLARVDLVEEGRLIPTLLESSDAGNSFSEPRPIDLTEYDSSFGVVPGYSEPIVDKGGSIHVPIILSDGRESVALNYVTEKDTLVEAIRVKGTAPSGGLEVFPSTVGSRTSFGNGITDGHGLIMVLGTEGRLFSSNSSAGGIYFPEASLLNHEMPLIAAFSASECYSSGIKANFVSMDYIYIEANALSQVASPTLHFETWDMPLPVPKATAKSNGSQVEITVLSDADLEPGKVMFGFDDPSITITDTKITSLRTATIDTNTPNLKGKTATFDILTLFHRHYGEAVIDY